MNQKMHIIALRQVKHSERHTILTAYSLENGRVAFAIPAGNGREASRMRALLMPLGAVECVAYMSAGQDVMRMGGVRQLQSCTGLLLNPIKSAVALFVAEVLDLVLREGEPDGAVWHYVCDSVKVLDELPSSRIANFHICFLCGLGRLLGIEPDVEEYHRGMIFDMVDGVYRITAPLHGQWLGVEDSGVVSQLMRMNYANMHCYRFSRSQRNDLLDGVLRYFSLHHTSLALLKSLDVLRSLF